MKKSNKKILAFLFFVLTCVGGWFARRAVEKTLDKTIGKPVDEVFEFAFNAMQAYLLNNTLSQVETKAQNGDTEAQFNLGSMYYFGKELKQNYSEAFKWWNKAAEQGDAQAQFNLGFMYANAEGVTQNKTEAFKWWRKAARQGQENAQDELEKLGEIW